MSSVKEFLLPVENRRLYRMGLVTLDGNPENMGIGFLASSLSGCLYDDIHVSIAAQVYKDCHQSFYYGDTKEAYQVLSKVYDLIGEPVPKPLQMIEKNGLCCSAYIAFFLDNWKSYLIADGQEV